MLSPTRVLLLRDGSWPQVPGVCCWRDSVHAAFAVAGTTVQDVVFPAPHPPARVTQGAPGARGFVSRLPAMARRPLVAAYRGHRTMVGSGARFARRIAGSRRSGAVARRLGTGLVIAESLAAASYAADAGVPRARLWALATPVDRLFAGEITGYAAELARVAPKVAGFLAGTEPARESVERVTSGQRTRVELFPHAAADRPCAVCGASGPGTGPPPELAGDPPVAASVAGDALAGAGLSGDAVPVAASSLDASGAPEDDARSGDGWAGAGGTPAGLPESAQLLLRARSFGTAAAQSRTASALLNAVMPRVPHGSRPRRRVLLAGYDLKFASELAQELDRRTDLAVTVDDWPDLGRPTDQTSARLRAADVVFAEWARTSAVWLAQRKRPDQFLAVRLHRFELDSRYVHELAIENVDAVVYIAPLFGRRIRDELGWPVEKLVYIPNYLDTAWLDRPKLPGARFTLGFVGMEWSRKRFDLALDMLSALRREDLRFTLAVRSAMPWQNEFAWNDPAEREYVTRCFTRIEQEPLLRSGVVFDLPGRDMARWYRKVGHLISSSDEEGSHASVAEAMAAGTVPVVRSWPGAAELYGREWIYTSTDEAVKSIAEAVDASVWAERADRARAEVRRSHDPVAVVEAWADLLHGDVAAAGRHFSEYAPVLRQAQVGVA